MKKSGFKRMTFLVLGMLLYAGTMTGWAQSGETGDLHWELVDGTLTISGEGAMPDYAPNDAPWYEYCNNIITVEIQDGVTSIGQYAFRSYANLTSLVISSSVTNVGFAAIEGCSALQEYIVSEQNLNYSSLDGVLFNKDKTNLIKYPQGKSGAYSIPSSVIYIADAFSGCSGLSSIFIPNSITDIGGGAFFACSDLAFITIPSSVMNIGELAFTDCTNLTAIDVDVANEYYCSIDGVLYNKDQTILVSYPTGKTGKFSIPDNVIRIGPFAFRSTNLSSVTISNSIESIDYQTFSTSNLTSVIIPNSVTSIGGQAFWYSRKLTSVTIPSSVTIIGGQAFFSCKNLASVTNLSPTPQEIDSSYVFYEINLNKVVLRVPAGSKALYEAAPIWQDFGKIVELTPHYIADYQSYPSTMTYTTAVLLDNVEWQSDGIEIGAFSGDECRGSVLVQQFSEADAHPYLGFLVVHGSGDEAITLRVYDHDTETEYLAINSLVTFVADAIHGNPTEPYPVNLISKQAISLSQGWSWISVNVANDTPSLINQFKSTIGDTGVMLKSWNAFIQNPGWIGTLSEIINEDMYMVNTTAEQTLSFTGNWVDPTSAPIALLNGWNWLGYPSPVDLPVNDALANLNPQTGDQIKSQSSYSVYTDGQGWIGSLETINPGNGYMYYSGNPTAQTLIYPSSSATQPAPALRNATEEAFTSHWTVDEHRFPNTMTATSVVLLDNVELQSNQIEIGAFSGDECRGSAVLKDFSQNTHSYMGFLVIHGEGNEAIRLRIYDHATGREYDANNVLSFGVNAIHGNPAEPYSITSLSSPTGINDIQANAVNIYLEPTSGNLQIHRPWKSIDRLEITDLSGRVVLQETGFTAESIPVSSLANSVYLLKLTKDNQVYVKKFIKN
jgi:hypothetical protein